MSKRLKIFLLASLLILIGFFGYYLYQQQARNAWADSDDPDLSPLRGWGWTDSTGWLSFNCRDTKLCNGGPTKDRNFCTSDSDCDAGFFCVAGCNLSQYLVAASSTENTSVGNAYALAGHAWSANVGWVSFNAPPITNPQSAPQEHTDCRHRVLPALPDPAACAICNTPGTTCYKWETAPNDCPTFDGDGATTGFGCGAWFDKNTLKIKGWAKVLSLKNSADTEDDSYGWVKLSVDANNPNGISVINTDGTVTQTDWGDLRGWAWNGNDDGTVAKSNTNSSGLGWFSFNCLDNPTGCTNSNYLVTGQPLKPTISSIVPTTDQDSTSVTINWTSVYGATGYEILRQDYICQNKPSIHCQKDFDAMCNEGSYYGPCIVSSTIASIGIKPYRSSTSYLDPNVKSFSTYKYRVRALNLLGGIASNPFSDYSVSPISLTGLDVKGICNAPKTVLDEPQMYVDLSWRYYYTYKAGQVETFQIQYCTKQTNGGICGSTDFLPVAPISIASSTADPTGIFGHAQWRHYIVEAVDPNDLYSKLKAFQFITYRVRAVGRDKICIDGTNDNVPCVSNCPGGACNASAVCVGGSEDGNICCLNSGVCTLTKTCQGGTNDGLACTADLECPEAVCDSSKSAWLMSSPAEQLCSPGTTYIEKRVDE